MIFGKSDSKLTIAAPKGDDVFEAQLNPESVKCSFKTSYDTSTKKNGDGEIEHEKNEIPSLSFSLFLDDTGVIPDYKATFLTEKIETLKKIVYDIERKKDENDEVIKSQPKPVVITWGHGIFDLMFWRLSSLGIDYTLFDKEGNPLRAKLDLAFVGDVQNEKKPDKVNDQRDKKETPPVLSEMLERMLVGGAVAAAYAGSIAGDALG